MKYPAVKSDSTEGPSQRYAQKKIDNAPISPTNEQHVLRSEGGSGTRRDVAIGCGRFLRATAVFDTYWRFAAKRQALFMSRVMGGQPPWTDDPVLAFYRFTNVYRAADRVSQYLIRHVLYDGDQSPEEVFFRAVLFKLFNRIGTWQELTKKLGPPSWKTYDFEKYSRVLDDVMEEGDRVYSAAYIMPSPAFGNTRKHRNHLRLLEKMMGEGMPLKVANASSLRHVFELFRGFPSIGDFLAYQFTIDLNYSELISFSEMEFVVAGPGAREGIQKCFSDTAGLSDSEIIRLTTERAPYEFERLGLSFQTLWGRPLQLIDCQNLYCEVDKYSRVVHPDVKSRSGRSRIKQKFSCNPNPMPQWYPPKWQLRVPMVTGVPTLAYQV